MDHLPAYGTELNKALNRALASLRKAAPATPCRILVKNGRLVERTAYAREVLARAAANPPAETPRKEAPISTWGSRA
jgi:hypothetical protein